MPILKNPTGTEFDSIFTVLPVHHVFHDSELNPRPIGENVVKLIEEFSSEDPNP